MPIGYVLYLAVYFLWDFKTPPDMKKDLEEWQRVKWTYYWGYSNGGNPIYEASYFNTPFDFLLKRNLQKPYQYKYRR